MASKKTKTVKKSAPKKKNVVKTQPARVVATAVKKNVTVKRVPKKKLHEPASSTLVDTSSTTNRYLKEFNDYIDFEYDLAPISEEEQHAVSEHKMFELNEIATPKIKVPLWSRILWWFVK